jgi:hypothetical protein
MPLGNLKDTLLGAIIGHPEVDFYINLIHCERGKEQSFHFDTAAIKEEWEISRSLSGRDRIHRPKFI